MVDFLIKNFTSGQLLILIIITELIIHSLFMKIFDMIRNRSNIRCLEKLTLSGTLSSDLFEQIVNNVYKEEKKNEQK